MMPVESDQIPSSKPEQQIEPESKPESQGTQPEQKLQVPEGFDKDAFLTALVSDPDVQAVLQARRDGRKIKVTDEEAETKPAPKKISDEIRSSRQTQETEDDGFEEDLDPTVMRIIGILEEREERVNERIEQLEELASGLQKQTVNNQIKEIEKKYPVDFPKYRSEMAKLSRELPKLSLEELLIVAKQRAGDFSFQQPSTESERPVSAVTRRGSKAGKSKECRGQHAWRNSLAEALEENLGEL